MGAAFSSGVFDIGDKKLEKVLTNEKTMSVSEVKESLYGPPINKKRRFNDDVERDNGKIVDDRALTRQTNVGEYDKDSRQSKSENAEAGIDSIARKPEVCRIEPSEGNHAGQVSLRMVSSKDSVMVLQLAEA